MLCSLDNEGNKLFSVFGESAAPPAAVWQLKITFGNCKHGMEWLFLGKIGKKSLSYLKFYVRNKW